MKAQALIFEQVVLFAMGVIIFVACFAAFSIYQSHFSNISTNDQLNEVKDIIVSNIVKLSQKGEEVNSSIELDIPERIGGRPYIIELDNQGLSVTLPGPEELFKFSPIFNLGVSGSLTLGPSRVLSTSGVIVIYKKENEIIII